MTTLSAARGSEPTALSFARWTALTSDQQAELIDELNRRPEIRGIGPMPIEEINNPAHRDFALGMLEAVGELELEDDSHATVGELQIQVQVWTIGMSTAGGGEIIAGRIDYAQQGCDLEGGEGRHFRSAAEAEAAGAEPRGLIWRAHAILNHELQPIAELPYVLESNRGE